MRRSETMHVVDGLTAVALGGLAWAGGTQIAEVFPAVDPGLVGGSGVAFAVWVAISRRVDRTEENAEKLSDAIHELDKASERLAIELQSHRREFDDRYAQDSESYKSGVAAMVKGLHDTQTAVANLVSELKGKA